MMQMVDFEKQEKQKLQRIEEIAKSLKHDSKKEKKTILQKIRQFGSNKMATTLILTLSLFAKYNDAYADTNKIKKEISHFNKWLNANGEKLDAGTISWSEALTRFEDAFQGLEKEVRHDLEEHKYEKALYNLQFFYRLAESLNQEDMQKKIYYLIQDVEQEIAIKQDREGIYNVNGKIYVVGKISASKYSTAQGMASSDAYLKLTNITKQIPGLNSNSKKMQGTSIQKIKYLEGENKYLYIISIAIVDDMNTTKQILEHIPQANI